ncbi:YqaJ viral recombinase family protein [Microbacterium gubbeenense]|uniref:YqaJ viral recombinase family protein n=1 Tax=Microbacterium gubbeenense TaxID=159896 RepID=UPI0003F85C7D|nr:YqaJ viral recombinase family protein [Microbacterium gubbeenense]
MTYLIIDDGADRERWLGKRRGGVTATDAARLMQGGAGTWATIRREKDGHEGKFRGNQFTRHGNEREPVIAAWLADEYGLEPSTALAASAERPEDLATPDAIAPPTPNFTEGGLEYVTHAIGEIKTTLHDWQAWEDVPRQYFWQVLWQMHVTGARKCIFAFEPHENFIPLYMEPRVFEVYASDHADETRELIESVDRWRAAADEPVPESLAELDRLLTDRAQFKEAADVAAAHVSDLDDQIRELIDAHGEPVKFEGTAANVTYSGKPVKSTRFDSKAFQARYPSAAKRFTKTTESRPRLTITARS